MLRFTNTKIEHTRAHNLCSEYKQEVINTEMNNKEKPMNTCSEFHQNVGVCIGLSWSIPVLQQVYK